VRGAAERHELARVVDHLGAKPEAEPQQPKQRQESQERPSPPLELITQGVSACAPMVLFINIFSHFARNSFPKAYFLKVETYGFTIRTS
jgi:hypothetical protein